MEGKDVGDFEIKRIIGEGLLGPVYLAEHKFIKKMFALKFLPSALLEDEAFKGHFANEIAKIASLTHENIASVHNVSSFKDKLFIVSDFIPYKSPLAMNLGAYLSTRSERLKEEEILQILREVAFALDYIHNQTVLSEPAIHGGVKLSNILLAEKRDGTYSIKLSDTGIVPMLGPSYVFNHMIGVLAGHGGDRKEELKKKRSFLQSFAFLAPEQRFAEDGKETFKSDIYAFGVLSYFLLMGHLPEGNYAMPSSLYKDSTVNWDMLVQACLHSSPEDRPDNLTSLIADATSMVKLEEVEEVIERSAYSFTSVSPGRSTVEEKKEPLMEKIPTEAFAAAETPEKAKELALAKVRSHEKPQQAAPRVEEPEAAESFISVTQLEQNLIGSLSKTVKTTPMKASVMEKKGESNVAEEVKDPSLIFKREKYVGAYKQEKVNTEDIHPLLTEMITIPGGAYDRGSNIGARDEKPRHSVDLNTFEIDKHPVTNEQFLRFLQVMEGEKDGLNHDIILLKESRIKRQGGAITIETGYAKHPVVGVSYYGAKAYAEWVGKRLPTEAEWEAAASMGVAKNTFPFGEEIERGQANFFSSDTTPVMSYPPSNNGLYDMVGNVYEWCEDWYDYSFYEASELEPDNPTGPKQGVYRVLRGGCWKSLVDDMRCSHRFRNNPGTMNKTYGFRCVSANS